MSTKNNVASIAMLFLGVAVAGMAQSSVISRPLTSADNMPATLSTADMVFANGVRAHVRTAGDVSAFRSSVHHDETGEPISSLRFLVMHDGPAYHRFVVIDKQYFGYDLEAKPVPGTDKIQLSIEPLSVDWDNAAFGQGVLPATKPTFPPSQIVSQGEEVVMDLATNPATGQKITEHIDLHLEEPPSVDPPHDLTLDEIPLHFNQLTLYKDGQIIGQTPMGIAGPVLAIHLPDGRWLYLSIKQDAQYSFESAGYLQGSRATLTLEGHEYELRSRSTILSPSKINLYAMIDRREPAIPNSFHINMVMKGAPGAPQPAPNLDVRSGPARKILPVS